MDKVNVHLSYLKNEAANKKTNIKESIPFLLQDVNNIYEGCCQDNLEYVSDSSAVRATETLRDILMELIEYNTMVDTIKKLEQN